MRLLQSLVVVLAVATAFGQENVGGSFDPREIGALSWEDSVEGILFFLACYGAWRSLTWFIESRRSTIPWKAMQRWVPSATLACAWATSWVETNQKVPHSVAVIFELFYLINLPGVAGAALIFEAFDLVRDVAQAPTWERLLAGSLGWWLAWYGVVRLLEWRAWAKVPVVLRIEPREP